MPLEAMLAGEMDPRKGFGRIFVGFWSRVIAPNKGHAQVYVLSVKLTLLQTKHSQ